VDHPFRPGDTVTVDTITGTVESIGLRSTRIRTLARTLVTLPNGRLSDMRIESYAPRDRMRLDLKLSLIQTTRAEQVRKIVTDIDAYLRTLHQLSGDPEVFFDAITQNSIDVIVGLGVNTKIDRTFQELKQEILLQLLAIVETNGSQLATPVRAIKTA
jgi:MscS family membrane protein